jgi:hypothetical protein
VTSDVLGLELEPDEGTRDWDDKFDGRKDGVWEPMSVVLGVKLVDGVAVVPDPVDGESLGAAVVEVPIPGDGAELVLGEAVFASLLLGAELALGDAVVTSLLLGTELTDGDKVDPGIGGGRNCEGKLDGRVVGISEAGGRNCEGKLEGNVVGIRGRFSLMVGAELIEGAKVVDPNPLVGAALVVEGVGADDGADSIKLGEELTEEGNIDPDDGSWDCEGKLDGRLEGVGERVSVVLGEVVVLVPDPIVGASLWFGAIVVEVGPEDGTELLLGARVTASVLLGIVDGSRDGKDASDGSVDGVASSRDGSADGPCDGSPLLGEEITEGGDVDPFDGIIEGSCDG